MTSLSKHSRDTHVVMGNSKLLQASQFSFRQKNAAQVYGHSVKPSVDDVCLKIMRRQDREVRRSSGWSSFSCPLVQGGTCCRGEFSFDENSVRFCFAL
ncbi:unnamed protein product [Litomosoides sigmodontis]|uniref:Uncharacterized protein n=1 Tax=Litomosoides sigmodontis TaxID=42156 RepID=A0A3P6SS94_LITSI|nr:unnamed protein product [Litomosoides sigmodontis]